jgi:hypothetical protein
VFSFILELKDFQVLSTGFLQEKLSSSFLEFLEHCPAGETVFDKPAFAGGGAAAKGAFGATKPPGAESAFLMDIIANKAEKKRAVVFIFVLV